MIQLTWKCHICEEIRPDQFISVRTIDMSKSHGLPSGTMQHAMEEQAAAERGRRATVTRAKGEKAAAILEADGRLEASRRDAEAQVVLAQASQTAIQKVTEAIQQNELPVMYMLGERYVDAIKDMSESENSKLIVLPADIPAAVRGLMGRSK